MLPNTLFSFVWHFLKPYKVPAFIFVALAIVAGFWGPFNNMLIKKLINLLPQAQATGDMSLLVIPAALIVLNFIIFDNMTWRGIGYINYKYQPLIKNQIMAALLQHVLGSSHSFFQNNLSGRISHQITILADSIEQILHKILVDFIRGGSLLVMSCFAAYTVHSSFFYIQAIWFIAFALFSIVMSHKLISLADDYAESAATVSGEAVDCITNQSNVRTFAKKEYELSRMNQFFQDLSDAFQKKEFFLVVLSTVQGLMIAVMMALITYFLVTLYAKKLIGVGDFALMLGLSMELGHMMWYTMSHLDDFNQAIGKSKQSLSALMIAPEVADMPHAKELKASRGEIVFDSVQFHYQGAGLLFHNKSVTINAGQKVGLVGSSGSGKSTFVNLILRFYDVTDGAILIDGQNIREVTQDSLRRSIAMIPQEPSLFNRTLMENIRYGRTYATDEEVIQAAQKAHANGFISRLPEGYQTFVGERGVKLSGGQRQRIAIARAALKNAPILILDEATSQLDSITESKIQDSLWDLMKNKTTLVIAHRLSTLLYMDRIMVFDKGEIVEDGTHAELLAQNGLYKKLWDAQVGGFLLDEQAE